MFILNKDLAEFFLQGLYCTFYVFLNIAYTAYKIPHHGKMWDN